MTIHSRVGERTHSSQLVPTMNRIHLCSLLFILFSPLSKSLPAELFPSSISTHPSPSFLGWFPSPFLAKSTFCFSSRTLNTQTIKSVSLHHTHNQDFARPLLRLMALSLPLPSSIFFHPSFPSFSIFIFSSTSSCSLLPSSLSFSFNISMDTYTLPLFLSFPS